MGTEPTHPIAKDVLQVLAMSIKSERKQRRWTQSELASRVGVNKETISRIERGDPGVSIGRYLEAAALTGVVLYTPDHRELIAERRELGRALSFLPSRVDSPRKVTNDF